MQTMMLALNVDKGQIYWTEIRKVLQQQQQAQARPQANMGIVQNPLPQHPPAQQPQPQQPQAQAPPPAAQVQPPQADVQRINAVTCLQTHLAVIEGPNLMKELDSEEWDLTKPWDVTEAFALDELTNFPESEGAYDLKRHRQKVPVRHFKRKPVESMLNHYIASEESVIPIAEDSGRLQHEAFSEKQNKLIQKKKPSYLSWQGASILRLSHCLPLGLMQGAFLKSLPGT